MTRLLITVLTVLVAVNFATAPLRAAQPLPCSTPAAHLTDHGATAASHAAHDDAAPANPCHSEHQKSASDACSIACASLAVGLRAEAFDVSLLASAGTPFDHSNRFAGGRYVSPEIDPPRSAAVV